MLTMKYNKDRTSNRKGIAHMLRMLCIVSCLPALQASAHNSEEIPLDSQHKHTGVSFIENKGQWNDTIRYKAEIGNGALFLTDQGFVYHFMYEDDLKTYHDRAHNQEATHAPPSEKQVFHHHAYKVSFLGAQNGQMEFKGENKRPWYHNYFIGNDSNRWRSSVGLYGKVTQQDIYPGVDMAIYQEGSSLKYDFIVAPGADPGQIILEFEGVQPRIAENGDLAIETSVNTIIEQAPVVYQKINGERKIIASRFKLNDKQVSYEILEDYNQAYPLIIDPTLVFATYSGSTGGMKYGVGTTFDTEGNFYLGAWVWGVGWPATVGAFQTNAAFLNDVGINKYNPDGSMLLFSTYFGGTEDDAIRTLLVNQANELVIAGTTKSSDMPTLPISFDTSFNTSFNTNFANNEDLFIAKLSSDGTTLLASTYLGSVLNEGSDWPIHYSQSPINIAVGEGNSIWVISNVELSALQQYPSSDLLPITGNAFQVEPGGGETDVLLAHFNADLSNLLFCSYFGGSKMDVGMGVQLNRSGNVVFSGSTNSPDLFTTTGVMHSNYVGGGSDGFVAIIDAHNYEILHSTYVGTNERDAASLLQVDENENILVAGHTIGNYPISPGVFNLPNGGVFIDKLSSDLSSSLLSTRLGNLNGQIGIFHIAAFLYDKCGRTYIGGFPNEIMPTTPDRLQVIPEGFWVGILEPHFSDLHFGTHYGTSYDHNHSSITRFDPYGVIYMYACNDDDYPTTLNAVFPTMQNTGVDAIAFKIDLEAEFVEAAIALPSDISDTGCAPYTIHFKNNTYCPFPVAYTWDFGDGSPTDTNPNPTHTFTDPGVYQVILKAYSAEACNLEDYDTLTVTIRSSEAPDIFTRDTAICSQREQVKLWVDIQNPSPDMYFEWSPEHAIEGSNNTDTVTVLPSESLTYTVKVGYRSNSCAVAEQDIHIDYAPRELALLNQDTILCKGDTLSIEAIGSEGYAYQWSPSIGVSDSSALAPFIIATASHTYTLTATHPQCDDTSQSFTLTVDTPYQAGFSFEPGEICVGQAVYFYPTSDPSVTNLDWTFDQQARSEAQVNRQYQHAFDQAGTFPITLQAKFRACPDTRYTDSITVYLLPEVDLGSDSFICLHGAPAYLKNLREAPLNPHHYLWSTGDTTASLKVVHPGIYTLSITTEPLGCTTTESIEITKDCYIDIPNAFTPNGDGHNDYFFPRQLLSESVSRFRMQVFNRWGQIIFQTTNLDGRGWDGRFNDKALPMGVYLYRIEVGFVNGHEEQYEGNVTLVR